MSYIILLVLMIPLIAVISDSPLGRALARRLERGGAPSDPNLARRLEALESEVERLDQEVRRLEEANEFLERLLTERPAPSKEIGSGESDG